MVVLSNGSDNLRWVPILVSIVVTRAVTVLTTTGFLYFCKVP